ncbi:MAG TPA: DNA topoisomerase IB [Chthoniobacteraceae bacterium]|nr:DNA topoisomerase IB [Chthoniobacteraceae bacterium]
MAAKSSTADASPNPFVEALASEAREAGLHYSSDAKPGIARRSRGPMVTYLTARGTRVRDAATIARIKHLAIPPAWTDVWINPRADGHIQATGRDARGRKQYRYHADWRKQRDDNKFGRIIDFARKLPRIRRRVARDLARRGMPREKVLATVVRLLESTLIRVGNDEYAQQNKSYGLTTMRNHHVRVNGAHVCFTFRGKSAKHHEIGVRDSKLASIVRRCQELPGQDLFGYEDDNGKACDVTSNDVNAYLREISGSEFTAKDFRTWAGTVLAAIALREFQTVTKEANAKKNIVAAIESVARMLGNTPTVCRKCYVHPGVLDSYLSGSTIATIHQRTKNKIDRSLSQLKPEEAAVLVLLQSGLRKKTTLAAPRKSSRKPLRSKSR